jgi:hypothetical protein
MRGSQRSILAANALDARTDLPGSVVRGRQDILLLTGVKDILADIPFPVAKGHVESVVSAILSNLIGKARIVLRNKVAADKAAKEEATGSSRAAGKHKRMDTDQSEASDNAGEAGSEDEMDMKIGEPKPSKPLRKKRDV